MDFLQSALFREVQMRRLFEDSKSFADAVPLWPLREAYAAFRPNMTDIELRTLVSEAFSMPQEKDGVILESQSATEHVQKLWPYLTRPGETEKVGTRFPIPHDYVVPGGRFNEIYYWDSYFTMLGLAVDGKYELIKSMIDNFAHSIKQFGFIPNGNREYFLSRSQPPFFYLMIRLYEDCTGLEIAQDYLESLLQEYNFWVVEDQLKEKPFTGHFVETIHHTQLARYWDRLPEPRPESYQEDVLMYEETKDPSLYRNLRSACESGWDFSSRWCKNPFDLQTIRTIAILPVDLNSLLYGMELLIAECFSRLGDQTANGDFLGLSESRAEDLIEQCYDPDDGFFFDYDFQSNQLVKRYYASAIFPLFVNMVEQDIANRVAEKFMHELVVDGGVLTSQIQSGQQWDAPNGWAPLNWVAYKAMKNYGFDEYAEIIRSRWITTIESYYEKHGKLVEKYNVLTNDTATGGEYPNQDGFGWTNGVYLAMKSLDED